MLQRGEILPDLDIDAEIELIESTKLSDLDASSVGGVYSGEDESSGPEEEPEEEEEVDVAKEVKRRLKALAEDNDEDDD